jgi:hypothetical protein
MGKASAVVVWVAVAVAVAALGTAGYSLHRLEAQANDIAALKSQASQTATLLEETRDKAAALSYVKEMGSRTDARFEDVESRVKKLEDK